MRCPNIALLVLYTALAPLTADEKTTSEPMAGGKPLSHWLGEITRDRVWYPGQLIFGEFDFEVLSALEQIGEPAVTALGKLLTDEKEKIRVRACSALCCLGETGLPALARALEHKDPRTRLLGVQCLGLVNVDAKLIVPMLTKALEDQEKTVRNYAAIAMALHAPDPKSIGRFLRAVQESSEMDSTEGYVSVSALVRRGNWYCTEGLIRAFGKLKGKGSGTV